MLRLLIFSLLLTTLAGMNTSCDKYAEGPMISFIPAKSRLCGDWRLISANQNGTDITSLFPDYAMSIAKDGTYRVEWTQSGFPFSDNGKWEFREQKSMLRMVDSDGDERYFTIVMLKSKKLKLREDFSIGSSTVYTYEAK